MMKFKIAAPLLFSSLLATACGHYRSYDDGCLKGVCVGGREQTIFNSAELKAYLPPHSIIPCHEDINLDPEEYSKLTNAQCYFLFGESGETCQDILVVVVENGVIRKTIDIKDCGWGAL